MKVIRLFILTITHIQLILCKAFSTENTSLPFEKMDRVSLTFRYISGFNQRRNIQVWIPNEYFAARKLRHDETQINGRKYKLVVVADEIIKEILHPKIPDWDIPNLSIFSVKMEHYQIKNKYYDLKLLLDLTPYFFGCMFEEVVEQWHKENRTLNCRCFFSTRKDVKNIREKHLCKDNSFQRKGTK